MLDIETERHNLTIESDTIKTKPLIMTLKRLRMKWLLRVIRGFGIMVYDSVFGIRYLSYDVYDLYFSLTKLKIRQPIVRPTELLNLNFARWVDTSGALLIPGSCAFLLWYNTVFDDYDLWFWLIIDGCVVDDGWLTLKTVHTVWTISQVDLQSVRDSVKYCCFLLEAEVTDSALLALSKEILLNKVNDIWCLARGCLRGLDTGWLSQYRLKCRQLITMLSLLSPPGTELVGSLYYNMACCWTDGR